MCGISGVVLRKNETVALSLLTKMGDAMIRRGPDSAGTHIHERFGLTHRRLKVVDLSDTANQPMVSQDGKVILVFNGEVYNFRELRSELELNHSRHFLTHSDTEVILQSYEVWGADCFRKFNGMFALAILDLRDGECVHLVRDRFGIKPLFYSLQEGRLAFASELKPLMEVDWLKRELNRDAIYYLLKFSHIPAPVSIYQGIEQLVPGTYLTYREGKSSTGVFYDRLETVASSPVAKKSGEKSEAEWLKELDQCFKNVISRQLVSDVPVGTFLSGGLDSSLLTLYSTEISGKPMDTFTIAYGEQEFDESSFAADLAKHAGARHHQIDVTSHDMLALLQEMPVLFDQPFADPTLLPSLILAREARKTVTVALSGDGGDELFFGYPYQQALSRLQFFRAVPRPIRRGLLSVSAAADRLLSNRSRQKFRKLRDILEFRSDTELLHSFIGTIGPLKWDRIPRLLRDYSAPNPSVMDSTLSEIKSLSWIDQIEQVFIRSFLTETVLHKTDRAGMAYGLEARVPFLDDEMVAFSSRLPREFKYREGQSKYLLRRLLKRKVPGDLADRKKQGFSIPLQQWLKGDLREILHQQLSRDRLEKDGIFDAVEIQKLLQEFDSGLDNHSHLLFSLLSFQLWKEHHL